MNDINSITHMRSFPVSYLKDGINYNIDVYVVYYHKMYISKILQFFEYSISWYKKESAQYFHFNSIIFVWFPNKLFANIAYISTDTVATIVWIPLFI